MKTSSFILVLAMSLSVCSVALACGKDKQKHKSLSADVSKSGRAKVGGQANSGVLLTGSYIKQDIRRNGRITDGANQVVVLDRETIERSGASDLKQLLVHQGIH